jgi:hypothetical protein
MVKICCKYETGGNLIMEKYSELTEAVKEVLEVSEESEEFKRRLNRLIDNAMKDSYRDDDIFALMNLLKAEVDSVEN